MNFTSLKNNACTTPQVLPICLLTLLLTLTSCGGSSSTTALKNELPSPVAEDIDGNILIPAPAGKEPVPASELAALPTINVKQRQLADPNVLLNLSGTVTPAAGATIVTTLWTQVSGPAVRIPSPLQLNNEIIIPDVTVATTLEFRLTAQDSNGKINSATVSILVKPVPTFVKVIGGVFSETDREAIFTLNLNAPHNLPVTLSYSTQDGSAKRGSDYEMTSGQIVFAAGETSKTLSVRLIDDSVTESDETFNVQVTAIDNETTFTSSGIALIQRNSEALLPQAIQFTTPAPAAIKVNSQYSNPLLPGPGTGAALYSSANGQIATVDSTGLVTAIKPGTTTITAIKAGDTVYAAAEVSYTLEISAGNAPFVSIYTGYNFLRNTKAALGEPLSFYGYRGYPENTNQNTYRWNSNLDGFLGSGYVIDTDSLSQGLHTLSQTVTMNSGDSYQTSALVLVGDLTRSADIVDAIPASCESLRFSNDPLAIADLYFGENYYDESCKNVVTSLTWTSPVTISTLALHLRTDLPLQDYTVEYWDKDSLSWKGLRPTGSSTVEIDNGDGSDTTLRQDYSAGAITTDQLRIAQPEYGSINELVVLGREAQASLPSAEDIDPIPLQLGQQLALEGRAFDKEDGAIPAQTQNIVWSSNLDGILGSDTLLNTSALTQGLHTITFSATDSDGNTRSAGVPVLVGNLAPLAYTEVSSERCRSETCYWRGNINDNRLNTDAGIYNSWINAGLELLETGDEDWISLNWSTPITTNTIDLYSTRGQVIQAYDIEYLGPQENWVKVVSVTDNTSVHRSHAITAITTSHIRVVVRKGSLAEPNLGRINELVVFGSYAAANPAPVSSSSTSSSSAISSAASSSAASSSIASSSVASSDNIALLAVASDMTRSAPCDNTSGRINDGDLKTVYSYNCGFESFTTLMWKEPVIITGVEIYTNANAVLSNFELFFSEGGSFKPEANSELHKIYELNNIPTHFMSLWLPGGGSINEVIVHGYFANSSSASSPAP